MPHTLEQLFGEGGAEDGDGLLVPDVILRFNNHLARPPILWNELKKKQDLIRKTVKNKKERYALLSKKSHELPTMEHKYAEGIDFTLADILLYACFDLIFHQLSEVDFTKISPLVLNWREAIAKETSILTTSVLLDNIKSHLIPLKVGSDVVISLPQVINESLYKSDPERPKFQCTGSMTNSRDVDNVMEALLSEGVEPLEYTEYLEDIGIPWGDVPEGVNPKEGSLPEVRLLLMHTVLCIYISMNCLCL